MEHRETHEGTPALPADGELLSLLERVSSVLEREDSSYRMPAPGGGVGGLIDLTGCSPSCPTIIIPDLHARWTFLPKVLGCRLPPSLGLELGLAEGATVEELLDEGRMTVVCVGDGLHSELHRNRWAECLAEFQLGNEAGPAMRQEMGEGLAVMAQVMRCKVAFPRNFHFLKGNHENILNQWKGGNRPFRKFVQEGEMCLRFMESWYGSVVLEAYSHFESLLPLVVAAPRCLVSHSEPARHFSRQEIIGALSDEGGEVVYGLTWTRNDESREGAVAAMLQELLPQWWQEGGVPPFGCLHFGGHRTISECYRLRQGGRFVQIHNPRLHQVALVPPHRPFDFTKDFICLDHQEV